MFDAATMGEAFARPGMDTRQWFSYAIVNPDTEDARSVVFTKDYGPLVSCTLQPSQIPILARVQGSVAGTGEAEWMPFVGGDEVVVGVPEGDERAGCVILGRMNQSIDTWPELVAGQDTTKNTIAFKRMIPPYILESFNALLFRVASTKAFISLDPSGGVTISNGDATYMTLGSTLLGFVDSDGNSTMQIDREQRVATFQVADPITQKAAGVQFDARGPSFLTTHAELLIGTNGNAAGAHAIGVEHLALILAAAFALDAPGGAAVVAALKTPTFWAGVAAMALDGATANSIGAALALPVDVTSGQFGIAASGLLIG